MREAFLAATLLAASASYAAAAPVILFDETLTADVGALPPEGITSALVGPASAGGGVLPGGGFSVTTPGPGTLTITAQDLGVAGDVFEVVLDGASLGLTPTVSFGGTVNSTGSFSEAVGAGFHTFGLWDPVLTYYPGTVSPFGAVPADFPSQTPLRLTVTFDAAPVPEPASLALLGAALGWAGLIARRRRAPA